MVDLGCFPGGWLQVAAEEVGKKGRVLGVDLKETAEFQRNEFTRKKQIPSKPVSFVGDITDPLTQERILSAFSGRADVLLSDLSPSLTGISFRDAYQSAELVKTAFEAADVLLKRGGWFVAKIFPGPESDTLFEERRAQFRKLQRKYLKSTRDSSTELYIVGEGFVGSSKEDEKKEVD